MSSPEESATSIRYARREDLPALADLARKIWWAVYPEIISTGQIEYMLKRSYDLAVLEAEMDSGTRFPLLWLDEALIGLASFGPVDNRNETKLHKLYLDPNYHGRGLGRQLLTWIENEAAALSFNCIILQVNKSNEQAIAAYRRQGFLVRDEIVVDIGQGYVMDDFLMEKRIPPMQ